MYTGIPPPSPKISFAFKDRCAGADSISLSRASELGRHMTKASYVVDLLVSVVDWKFGIVAVHSRKVDSDA